MARLINLQRTPRQRLRTVLGGMSYEISLSWTGRVIVFSLSIDGEQIIQNMVCPPAVPLIPYKYLENLNGNFIFVTGNDSNDLPDYKNFGDNQFLIYLTNSEVEAARNSPAPTREPLSIDVALAETLSFSESITDELAGGGGSPPAPGITSVGVMIGDANVLYAYDINLPSQVLISSNIFPNTLNPFAFISSLSIDDETGICYVFNAGGPPNILAVDITTGARSVLASGFTYAPFDMAMDKPRNRLVMTGPPGLDIQAVNLSTGAVTTLADNSDPLISSFAGGIVVDDDRGRIIFSQSGQGLFALDVNTNVVSVFSSFSLSVPNANAPDDSTTTKLTIDNVDNTLYAIAFNQEGIISYDLLTGVRTEFEAADPTRNYEGIAYDFDNGRVLAYDRDNDQIDSHSDGGLSSVFAMISFGNSFNIKIDF